ncbi:hypothetical protein J2X19_000070 [Rhodoferax ferrireducens]|uniref:Uncharacterized protein n=1 Tax=Rhodoferax ferrireducens TaxID=192843 RepID=A0ABU2C241_9BURK|nr:hypothetical protein [Rhodoferax ferrireducens]MDR7375412.1 hypothetical protein [Rhodoferax ferrireducens]
MSVYTVPVGTTVISVGKLLQWIAEQVIPVVEVPSSLGDLTKQMLLGRNDQGLDHWQDQPLALEDWAILDRVWKGLPDVLSVDQLEWPAYKGAFERWKQANPEDAPPWRPAAIFVDQVGTDQIKRSNVFNTHYWVLDGRLKSGETRGISEDRVETRQMGPGVLLPVAEAKAYLEQAGFTLEVGTIPASAQSSAAPAPAVGLDYSLLATPAELLDAFGKWGMQAAWFSDLNSRKWLHDSRRRTGQGQRGHTIEPLFCPFEVMNGLIRKVRKEKRLQPDTAWRTLEHKFPKVYATFENHDPRDRTRG